MTAAWGFAASAAFLLWVMAGHPLWLAWRARRARPVRKHFEPRAVSVVIPVRNGAHYIRRKLESVLDLDYPRELLEVLVVSDGSTDGTDDVVRKFSPAGVVLLRIPASGKPAALSAAFERVRGEILLLTDVRQSLEPESLRALVACFADPAVGAVSGELLLEQGGSAEVGLYWRYESWIRRNLSAVDSMFGATGPFYALRRELAIPIPPKVLLDDMYLPLAAFFRGYRLIVEERARAWDYPTSVEIEFQRKVRTLAGNYQLLKFYPGLLGPRNRMWLDYVSYKLGRLLLPFALAALAGFSFSLPGAWKTLALAAQAAGYGLALADPWVPRRSPVKGVSSAARTFAVMMLAALCALAVFVVPPQRLWKVTSAAPPDVLEH